MMWTCSAISVNEGFMIRTFLNLVRRFRADEVGATSIIMGVLMIPLVGTVAIGFEASNWYMITRGMQNAADAAALAAATNGGSNYDVEARAVAARYGPVNGTNTITIATSHTAACPRGVKQCFWLGAVSH